MQALEEVRRRTLELYRYVVSEYNRERKENTDLPSSKAVQAYLRGAISAYSIVLKNLRYYTKKEKVYERVEW